MTHTNGVDLRTLSQEALLQRTKELVTNERRIGVEILRNLAEINRRRSYAKVGYPSLWEYCLRELKYTEAAAYRRISAMRAMEAHPELEKKIENGSISVSAVSQVESFLKAEQAQSHRSYTKEQKGELFRRCENKSTRDVTRELLTLSPLAIRVQKERVITENRTLISFVADTPLLGKFRRVRDLSVAKLRDPASYPELVDLMSEVTLDRIDPLRRPAPNPDKSVAVIAPQATKRVSNTRSIPEPVRRAVWHQFRGQCAYVSPEGKRCESTFGLEIEHCKPFGMGGSSKDPANLRLLCRRHNQLQAIETYGLAKMEGFLNPKSDA